ncbi:MAG: 3-deoxy-D-manno-octulosonic acid transferase [Rhodospirillales bacterium]|nr:3-deoxy-D-manno-octulosonic acid transferase [Rhodospirillales bacterium]MBO6788552.1 3-deoxy-D-manno-octulosonic acid transferase [Rhodospirillales bacterium]
MILSMYRLATAVGAPLISHYLKKRLKRGKEDAARFPERRGVAGLPRPDGRLIWMHGASVGESLSMLPVIEELVARPGSPNVLVTTGTVTSARLMRERLPDGAIHQFVPVDRLPYVRAFLDYWKPDLALWWESELWPNLVIETHDRGVPMILVNARMSPPSFLRWQRWRSLARALLGCFRTVLAQTDTDVERYRALGANNVVRMGNMKFAVPALPCDEGTLAEIRARTGLRPMWLAASTHAGEEAAALAVHRTVRETHPDLLTIIVPRHPDRGPEIAQMLRDAGASVAVRTNSEPVTAETDVYLADTLGELGLFFRLSPIVFMGKSLVPAGGQNTIEPARLGAAIITGPHYWNFDEITKAMVAAGGLEVVQDADALADAINRDLDTPAEAQARAKAAFDYVERESQVLDVFMDHISPYLESDTEKPRERA